MKACSGAKLAIFLAIARTPGFWPAESVRRDGHAERRENKVGSGLIDHDTDAEPLRTVERFDHW